MNTFATENQIEQRYKTLPVHAPDNVKSVPQDTLSLFADKSSTIAQLLLESAAGNYAKGEQFAASAYLTDALSQLDCTAKQFALAVEHQINVRLLLVTGLIAEIEYFATNQLFRVKFVNQPYTRRP